MRFGGMPGIADVGMEQDKALTLLEGIYSTVIVRDILEREKSAEGSASLQMLCCSRKSSCFWRITLAVRFQSLPSATHWSVKGCSMTAAARGKPSAHTVQAYVNALLESYFFYEIKRFDIKGREFLRTLGKYYIVDIGLRNYLLDSATATADMRLKMLYISNCCAAAMMSQSARSATRKLILLQPKLMKKYTCR